jgi:hypothetical protein
MSKGKTYNREFKVEAVQLLNSGQSLAQSECADSLQLEPFKSRI